MVTRKPSIRIAAFLLVLLVGGTPAGVRGQDSQVAGTGDEATTFTLNVNVDLVQLQVLATDRFGTHVTTLGAEDFEITEDGVSQKIALFRQFDLPVSLGVVIDNSRSMTRKKERVDLAALSFVSHNNPDDEAFVIHFDDTARVAQTFTANPEPVRRALESRSPYGQTALYDAIELALETVAAGRYDEKAILVISDGADNASMASYETVLEAVRESAATLYAIGVFTGPAKTAEARDVLEALAEAGGGRAFFPDTPDEVPALTQQIAEEIRDQYTLGYVPTNFRRDGTWRSVRVLVREEAGKDIGLSYRHGYYAPEQ
jgi:Ca-activated chloride channel homolog